MAFHPYINDILKRVDLSTDDILALYWKTNSSSNNCISSMFDFLKKNFEDFIYLPLLVIDSANQPMEIESFREVYPTIFNFADTIGLQTIFLSKDRIDNISNDDFINISEGLNKFHKQQAEL